MIIDCHGHYTTAPAQLQRFRDAQLAALDGGHAAPSLESISDDELRDSVEANQLRILRERGGDVMIFSPKASGMEHHVTDPATAVAWARASNDLVARVAELYPETFAGVGQLPQTPGGSTDDVVAELRRCVDELGFVGANLNPDPSGGFWTSPPLTDPYWFPVYEALVDLDVPAMVHVSSSCNRNFHALGAHYLNADTSAFMQLLEGDLFQRFPTLRLVIPHGGGAVPYHWGRYRGLAMRMGLADPSELLRNVFFDTCVYHQPGIDLLTRVLPAENILFASEMLGAVRGADPETGIAWDDTKKYVDAAGLSAEQQQAVFSDNARRVYPRLDARLSKQGEVTGVSRLQLTFACGDYDRTRAIEEGTVRPDGIDLTYLRLPVEETFFRMMRHREFEVAEMSLSSYVKSLDSDERPFVALPVYTSRQFRHAGIFVHADSGIEKPEDLVGKVVGTPEWQLTAGVWIRGILADHHGVPIDSVEYRTGGQETPGRIEKAAVDLGGRVRIEPIGPDQTLAALLAAGEIDAFQGPRVPSSFVPGGPVRRLFADPVAAEKQYFAETGIFPIMHVVALRRDVYEKHPWVAQTLTKALLLAKKKAAAELYDASALRFMLPWLIPGLEEARTLLGEDYWSYGLEANRHVLETFLRYHSEQGLSRRQYAPEELFAPEATEAFVI